MEKQPGRKKPGKHKAQTPKQKAVVKSEEDKSEIEHPKRRSPLEHLKETINSEKSEIKTWKYTTTLN
jgi:hypothetical protein